MKTLEEIMTTMAGKTVLTNLADLLRTHEPDFRESEAAYQEAVNTLYAELPAEFYSNLDQYIKVCENDVISRIVYAGYLGYRVNLENFKHPIMVDFVHLDTIDYIKDHLMGHFPINYKAAYIQESFYKSLPEHLKKHHDAIADYFIHFECSGPKLAHYAGYVIANKLLPWVEPGYQEDWHQTQMFAAETTKVMGYLPL